MGAGSLLMPRVAVGHAAFTPQLQCNLVEQPRMSQGSFRDKQGCILEDESDLHYDFTTWWLGSSWEQQPLTTETHSPCPLLSTPPPMY